jgi:hypothetical protein
VVAARHGRRYIAADSTWRAIYTTYSRLVGAAAPVFKLEFDQKSEAVIALQPMHPIPERLNNEICLSPQLLSQAEFWEIDPAWDGPIFHSRLQACRGKKGQVAASLSIPENAPGPIAIRMVTIDGRRMQSIIRV